MSEEQDYTEQQLIEIGDAANIIYDFCPAYWVGQGDVLYRIGSSGTFYPEDIEYVDQRIEEALMAYQPQEEEGQDWEMLLLCQEEINNLKNKYGKEGE